MSAPEHPDVEAAIAAQCEAIAAMLIAKNRAYGNSALDPVRVFSRADAAEQIRVRIDDKLSRLQRGKTFGDEDTVLDLIGYLVLLRVALSRDAAKPKRTPVTRADAAATLGPETRGAELDKVGALLGLPRVQVPSRLPSGGTTMEGDTEYRARMVATLQGPEPPVEFDDEDSDEHGGGAR